MTLSELFSEPARWTQYAIARDSSGCIVPPDSKDAVSFCLMGGLEFVYPEDIKHQEIRQKLVDAIRAKKPKSNISNFNDTSTYEQVLALVKEIGV